MDNISSFMGFIYSNMVDSFSSIVLLGGKRNIIGSTSWGRCKLLKRASARIGALVGKMTFLTICIALPFSLQWILSSLGPLNILISSSRDLKIVGELNHLTLWG
jgi:hypothetical protein